MHEHRRPDVKEWLRDGDPAADRPGLAESERAAIRARVVAAARDPAPASRPLWARLLPAAAVACVLIVVGALLPGRERFDAPPADRAFRLAEDGTPLFFGEPTASGGLGPRTDLRPRSPLRADGRPRAGRHIEFTTPGGHRVVWNLDTEFRLPDDAGSGDSPSIRS